MRYHN